MEGTVVEVPVALNEAQEAFDQFAAMALEFRLRHEQAQASVAVEGEAVATLRELQVIVRAYAENMPALEAIWDCCVVLGLSNAELSFVFGKYEGLMWEKLRMVE